MKTNYNHLEKFFAITLVTALCIAACACFNNMLNMLDQVNNGVQQYLSEAESYAGYLSRK